MKKLPQITVNGRPLEEVEGHFDGDAIGRDRCAKMRMMHARRARQWYEGQLVGSGRLLKCSPRITKNPHGRVGGVLIK